MKETIENLLDKNYREYSMYVIYSRAIPSICDGLKLVQKRALWTAKENAKDFTNVNTLSGIAVRLHPHGDGSISSAIGGLAQDFAGANNYPLFTGKGAFGSRLSGPGNGIGAARYVKVKISDAAKKLLLADVELINLIPNYDGDYTECENFLPIVPIALLNGVTGVAVGFATEIQPYNIDVLIKLQQKVLAGEKLTEKDIPLPWFRGFKGKVYKDSEGTVKCRGVYKLDSKTDLVITELPIGWNREQYKKFLDDLEERGSIRSARNDSKDGFLFRVKLPRSSDFDDETILKTFKLEANLNQNLNLIDTRGKLKTYNNVCEIIEEFTNWRVAYYKKRYELLSKNLNDVISYNRELLKFIKFVIDTDYIKRMSAGTKATLVKDLDGRFKFVDKLVGSPIYYFNKEKIDELKKLIEKDEKQIDDWASIIGSTVKQKHIYQKELESVKL
jgi:DNA topoisomerase-2